MVEHLRLRGITELKEEVAMKERRKEPAVVARVQKNNY